MTDKTKPYHPVQNNRFADTLTGASLREVYAGQILAGMLSNSTLKANLGDKLENEKISNVAVSLADALVAELERVKP